IAGSRLWPLSILPKKACTRPLGSTAIQESSSPGTRFCLAAESPAAIDSSKGTRTETTSAPLACRNSRREIGAFMIASSRHALLSTLDSAQDRHVGAAAALEAGERIAQLGIARLWILLQDGGGGHDPAVDAVAALRHLLLDIRRLQRMGLLGRAQALEAPSAAGGVCRGAGAAVRLLHQRLDHDRRRRPEEESKGERCRAARCAR